jgi:hypothetical protein
MVALTLTLGQLCAKAGLAEQSSIDTLLETAARLKFDEVLQRAGHNFVDETAGDATDPWPLVSFAATPYGNPALSERTLQSRNQ